MATNTRKQVSDSAVDAAASRARRALENRDSAPAAEEQRLDDPDGPAPRPAASLDTFNINARVEGAPDTSAVEDAGRRRLDPLFESAVEGGRENTEPGTDGARKADEPLRNSWSNEDNRKLPGAATSEENEDAADDDPFDFSDPNPIRSARREAVTSELSTMPDTSSPHERDQSAGNAPGPSKGGEQSLSGGGGGTSGDASGGGTGGTPAFGLVADLKDTGTDYSDFTNEGSLTAGRMAGMGKAPVEVGFMMDKAAAAAEVDTEPSVAVAPLVVGVGVGVLGAVLGAEVVTAAGMLLGADDAVIDELVSKTDDAKWAEDMAARADQVKALSDAGLKGAVKVLAEQAKATPGPGGSKPDPSQPVPGEDGAGGRPTPSEWAYRQWLLESTGRNPFGPGSGDVNPVDEPVGTVTGTVDIPSAVEMFGQPGQTETAGVHPRGELRVAVLPGDQGDVDPGEDDTGPWTSDPKTDDPADALDTNPTLGIGALQRNSSDEDDDEEEEDS